MQRKTSENEWIEYFDCQISAIKIYSIVHHVESCLIGIFTGVNYVDCV